MSELGRHGLLLLRVGHRLSTLGGCAWQLGCVNSSAMVHSKTLLPSKIKFGRHHYCFLFPLSGFISSGVFLLSSHSLFHHFINFMGSACCTYLITNPFHLPKFYVLSLLYCSVVAPYSLPCTELEFRTYSNPEDYLTTGATRFLRQRQPSTPEPSCSELRSPPSPESMQNPGPEAPR